MPDEYEFDAESFARAWLAVFTAVGSDPERPMLYRAVAIEKWEDGMRLIATDSFMLWAAWVPAFGYDGPEPMFGELPDSDATIVACDEEHRVRDLLKFAFKVVTAKDAMPQHLKVNIGPAPLEAGQFPGTERDQVCFSFPADAPVGERVVIRNVEGQYPEWRSLLIADDKAVDGVHLSPELLGRVSSIKRFYGEPIRFSFSGTTSRVHLAPVIEGRPPLVGALMPVRMVADE